MTTGNYIVVAHSGMRLGPFDTANAAQTSMMMLREPSAVVDKTTGKLLRLHPQATSRSARALLEAIVRAEVRPTPKETTVETKPPQIQMKCRESGCSELASKDGPRVDLRGMCSTHKNKVMKREGNAKQRAKKKGDGTTTAKVVQLKPKPASKPRAIVPAPRKKPSQLVTVESTPSKFKITVAAFEAEFSSVEELATVAAGLAGLFGRR